MFQFALPNTVTNGADFYISYNCIDDAIYGCDTTALVYGQMEAFYILNGDHQAAYRDLIPQGWDACMAYFIANIDKMNMRSDPVPDNA